PNTPQQLTMLSNLVPLEKKADANLNINPNVNTDTVHENISLNTDNNLNKPINEISADINNRNINNNTPNNNTTNNIANNKSQKDNRDINDRKNLIPGRVQIKINNPRINQVYKELKKIDINQLPNAVAVLFRVFIEISMDEYIEINTLNNVTQNSKLNNKVQECLNDLKTKKLIKQEFIKPVNVSISDKDSIMSINTFNSYVHNKHMFPDSTQLKNSWNQLEGFLIAIHKNC
ncbi:MAG: hypothetical protein IJH34_13115, partial [Romboutsia sp.]|nr:hypothetical protein [Romboutsia sp.]